MRNGGVGMADITMCSTEGCSLEPNCFRKQATANEHRQSYAEFEHRIDGRKGLSQCAYYWPLEIVYEK